MRSIRTYHNVNFDVIIKQQLICFLTVLKRLLMLAIYRLVLLSIIDNFYRCALKPFAECSPICKNVYWWMLLQVFQILWPMGQLQEIAFLYVSCSDPLTHLGNESRPAWEMTHFVSCRCHHLVQILSSCCDPVTARAMERKKKEQTISFSFDPFTDRA